MLILNAASLLNNSRHLLGQVISLASGCSLGIHANGVLSSTGASEGPAILKLGYQGIDFGLNTLWLDELALGVGGLKEVSIADLNAYQAVWKIGVSKVPLSWSPGLVCEDDLNQKHIREGVSNGLVDQVVECEKGIQSVLLTWRLWVLGADSSNGLLGEYNGAVTVGLKVNADVKLGGSMVEPLHTGWCADSWQLEGLGDVVGAGAVGVSSLNNTDLQLVSELGLASKVANKGSGQSGNLISVQKSETVLWVLKVVDDSVCVSIEGAAAVVWLSFQSWRSSLLGLYEIGTTLKVVSQG